tara:strand:+ start:1287 stop:2036 length:750 start_codon:yes stop_codon:yes gene_type:complete
MSKADREKFTEMVDDLREKKRVAKSFDALVTKYNNIVEEIVDLRIKSKEDLKQTEQRELSMAMENQKVKKKLAIRIQILNDLGFTETFKKMKLGVGLTEKDRKSQLDLIKKFASGSDTYPPPPGPVSAMMEKRVGDAVLVLTSEGSNFSYQVANSELETTMEKLEGKIKELKSENEALAEMFKQMDAEREREKTKKNGGTRKHFRKRKKRRKNTRKKRRKHTRKKRRKTKRRKGTKRRTRKSSRKRRIK